MEINLGVTQRGEGIEKVTTGEGSKFSNNEADDGVFIDLKMIYNIFIIKQNERLPSACLRFYTVTGSYILLSYLH